MFEKFGLDAGKGYNAVGTPFGADGPIRWDIRSFGNGDVIVEAYPQGAGDLEWDFYSILTPEEAVEVALQILNVASRPRVE